MGAGIAKFNRSCPGNRRWLRLAGARPVCIRRQQSPRFLESVEEKGKVGREARDLQALSRTRGWGVEGWSTPQRESRGREVRSGYVIQEDGGVGWPDLGMAGGESAKLLPQSLGCGTG